MPSVNISEESMDKIEEIQELDEFDPPKRQVAEKAIDEFHESFMARHENESASETENPDSTQEA